MGERKERVMILSTNFLKDYLDIDFDTTDKIHELAENMTKVGNEYDSAKKLIDATNLTMGEVLECEMHPDSDHLHVCKVNVGDEVLQIVCGAPNVAAGQKIIIADLGCVLYDGEESFTIKKSKLRGVESLGMICAEDEIGVGTDHAGIIVLPEKSYSSKKLYKAIGISYHQFGYPIKKVS